MSPGSVTEKLFFFTADDDGRLKIGKGGRLEKADTTSVGHIPRDNDGSEGNHCCPAKKAPHREAPFLIPCFSIPWRHVQVRADISSLLP